MMMMKRLKRKGLDDHKFGGLLSPVKTKLVVIYELLIVYNPRLIDVSLTRDIKICKT